MKEAFGFGQLGEDERDVTGGEHEVVADGLGRGDASLRDFVDDPQDVLFDLHHGQGFHHSDFYAVSFEMVRSRRTNC